MKKALSLLMCVLVLTLSVAMPVSAAAADNAPERSVSVEYLDDGSYFVIEVLRVPEPAIKAAQKPLHIMVLMVSPSGT